MNATQNGQLDIPKSSLYSNGHIEYYPGTMNVILSVPHGGRIKPANIPDRDAGYFADDKEVYDHNRSIKKDAERLPVRKKCDRFTIELSMLIAKELQVLSGKRPHIVINHLYRGKMDANCDVGKATFNVPDAVSAWHAFHDCINSAKQSFNGRGLFLDIHGQSHPEDWVELGYTIPVESLNEGSYSVTDTSVANLIRVKNLNVEDLICGAQSLGSFIESQGYPTVPSPRVPSPGNSNIYTGGFNTITHGSKRTGSVDSIQIECPYKARLEKTGIPFAKALARSIYKFWTIYYEK